MSFIKTPHRHQHLISLQRFVSKMRITEFFIDKKIDVKDCWSDFSISSMYCNTLCDFDPLTQRNKIYSLPFWLVSVM